MVSPIYGKGQQIVEQIICSKLKQKQIKMEWGDDSLKKNNNNNWFVKCMPFSSYFTFLMFC